MSVSNVTTQLGSKKTYDNSYESYIIRINDPKEGKVIESGSIKEIVIEENLFSLLPTLRLEVEDQGAFFASYNLKNGDKIYFMVTPCIEEKGSDPKPYIDTVFVIQNISCMPMGNNNNYQYIIIGIFDAQPYLNEVSSYPKTTTESLIEQNRMRSHEAIREILDDTTLKLVNRVDGDDNSLWLNCTKTRAQCIEKILDHAWIELGDAPILYTDVFGNAYYSSIKYLAQSKKLCQFTAVKNYIDNLKEENGADNEELIYPFTSVEYLHAAGPILNQGGYKVKANYYTPYNALSLFDEDIKDKEIDIMSLLMDIVAQGDLDVTSIATAQMADGLTKGKFREAVYQQDDPYIASQSNKAASQMDRLTRNIDAGIYFKEYHDHYDVAPVHNEMIRRSFFQNFVNMTFDVHRMPTKFQLGKCRPTLGDKVYIDFSNAENVDKIHSGNYIIAGLAHHFKSFQSYTIKAICVTDGVFGKGILDENPSDVKEKSKTSNDVKAEKVETGKQDNINKAMATSVSKSSSDTLRVSSNASVSIAHK
jgi:hypothetical protein